MKTTITTLDDNKARLDIELSPEDLGPSLDRAARELSRDVKLKGFRPGRIPRKVLERHMGSRPIRDEAVRYAIPEALADAIVSEELDILGRPRLDEVTTNENEGPLAFSATVDLRPELTIGDLSDLEVTLEGVLGATDEEVDEQVDALRNRFATSEAVARPAHDGDFALVNIDAHIHDERVDELSRTEFLYPVGSGMLVPKLDTELEGKRAGEIVRFNDVAPEGFEHAGDEIAFSVLVKEVQEKKLPEVTDDWVSEASEFDTVVELRSEITSSIEAMKRRQAQGEATQLILDALVERAGLNVPESLVEEEVEGRVQQLGRDLERRGANFQQYFEATGDTAEELMERMAPDAKKAVEAALILRAVAGELDVEATEAEIDNEVAVLAVQAGENPDKVRRTLEKAGTLDSIAGTIIRAKAIRRLLDDVRILDSEGTPVDVTAGPAASEGDEVDDGTDLSEGDDGGSDAAVQPEVVEASDAPDETD